MTSTADDLLTSANKRHFVWDMSQRMCMCTETKATEFPLFRTQVSVLSPIERRWRTWSRARQKIELENEIIDRYTRIMISYHEVNNGLYFEI